MQVLQLIYKALFVCWFVCLLFLLTRVIRARRRGCGGGEKDVTKLVGLGAKALNLEYCMFIH